MEVHHHSHTSSQKWTHYFWEFFMLFLAVTLGFFVENQREHFIEHKREKQYMVSMLRDLTQDLKNIKSAIQNRKSKSQIADSLTSMLIDGDYSGETSLIYFCARRFSIAGFVFHPTDGTLMQLKNSGGLRLIRKQSVVESLQDYYNSFQQYQDNRELEMLQLRDYRDMMVKVFNVRIFDTMIREFPITRIPEGNPALFQTDKILINELLMRVHLSKRMNLVELQQLEQLESKAADLLKQIKSEYDFK